MEDGSYLRLKNVSLGYNFPKKWINKYKVSQCPPVCIGYQSPDAGPVTQGADPEVSTLDGSTTAQGIDFFTFPQVKNLLVGATLSF